MTIEATFQHLLANFGALREALQCLRLTAVEDRPLGDGVVLLDRIGEHIDDLNGWLEEGCEAAQQASNAVARPLDGPQAIQRLSQAHERFLQLEYEFFLGLASYPQIADLSKFARSRGGEWRAWSGTVKEALDQTARAVSELDHALLAAWQELAERVGTGAITVQTSNIGQQFSGISWNKDQSENHRV
jgi:hypothetical protein